MHASNGTAQVAHAQGRLPVAQSQHHFLLFASLGVDFHPRAVCMASSRLSTLFFLCSEDVAKQATPAGRPNPICSSPPVPGACFCWNIVVVALALPRSDAFCRTRAHGKFALVFAVGRTKLEFRLIGRYCLLSGAGTSFGPMHWAKGCSLVAPAGTLVALVNIACEHVLSLALSTSSLVPRRPRRHRLSSSSRLG